MTPHCSCQRVIDVMSFDEVVVAGRPVAVRSLGKQAARFVVA